MALHADQRASRYEHIEDDEILAALEMSFATGLDTLPPDLTAAELGTRLDGHN